MGERTTGPIFLGAKGERMDRSRRRPHGQAPGTSGGQHQAHQPQSLRHSFITAALDAGVPLRDVQEVASHADPRTTMRHGVEDRSTATPPTSSPHSSRGLALSPMTGAAIPGGGNARTRRYRAGPPGTSEPGGAARRGLAIEATAAGQEAPRNRATLRQARATDASANTGSSLTQGTGGQRVRQRYSRRLRPMVWCR